MKRTAAIGETADLPNCCIDSHQRTPAHRGRTDPRTAAHRRGAWAWRGSSRPRRGPLVAGVGTTSGTRHLLVPTLRVRMLPGRSAASDSDGPRSGPGPFPRGAWERGSTVSRRLDHASAPPTKRPGSIDVRTAIPVRSADSDQRPPAHRAASRRRTGRAPHAPSDGSAESARRNPPSSRPPEVGRASRTRRTCQLHTNPVQGSRAGPKRRVAVAESSTPRPTCRAPWRRRLRHRHPKEASRNDFGVSTPVWDSRPRLSRPVDSRGDCPTDLEVVPG